MMPSLDAVIATSALLISALMLAALCRRASAAVRHLILSVAVASAIALPLARTVVPAWRFPLGGGWSDSHATDQLRSPALMSQSVAPDPGVPPAASRDVMESVRQLLIRIWWTGVLLSLFRLFIGLARLVWLGVRAEDVQQPEWTEAAADVSVDYGVFRPVRLLRSDHPSLLVTWGVVRPRIMLPAGSNHWSAERIRIVLRHELAHIRRCDWATQMAAELLRSAYWFNPLAWIACRRLRQESEQACDDLVLHSGVAGSSYAMHLVDLARAALNHRASPAAALAIARTSSLERRIRVMLTPNVSRNPLGRSTGIALTIAGLCLAAPVAGFTTSFPMVAQPARGAQRMTVPTKVVRQSVLDRRRPVDRSQRDPRLGVVAGTTLATLAQASFATFFGSLVDPHGGVLPGVTLTLANTQSGAKQEVHSDRSGRFEFVGLPSGNYQFEARLPGFETLRRTIWFGDGMTAEANFSMQIGSIVETISVVADNDGSAVGSFGGSRPASDRPARTCSAPVAGGIGGNLKPPLAVDHARPVYPASARSAKVEGVVILAGRIDTSGLVTDLHALRSPDADLTAAALEAVGLWRFDATLLNCVPIDTAMTVTVNFSLAK